MKKTSFHILRIGLAITFLWIGFSIFKNPDIWIGYLEPWAARLLPVSIEKAMLGTAILDAAIGIFLLANVLTWLAALIGAIHLAVVLVISGITDITVRDIGLLAAALALTIDSWSSKMGNKDI